MMDSYIYIYIYLKKYYSTLKGERVVRYRDRDWKGRESR